MRWMDLELCTRDSWCKTWPRRELVHHAHSLPEFLGLWSRDGSLSKLKKKKDVLANGLSACAEWMLNFVQEIAGVNTNPEGSWSAMHILFLSFLVYEAETLLSQNWRERKNVLANGLSACAEWILNFVQEIPGVRTDPQGSWFIMHIPFLSFLVCEAEMGLS